MSDRRGADRYGFVPQPGRVLTLDRDKHEDLKQSLAHVAEAAAHVAPELAEALNPTIRRLQDDGAHLPPQAFGLYYDIVEAVAADDLAQATAYAAELARLPDRPSHLVVQGRGTEANASLDAVLDRRLGPGSARFAPVSEARANEMEKRIHEGLALLHQGVHDLWEEITGLVRQVCVAQEPEGAKMRFDGASHYQFWGLLFLNPNFHPDRLAVAEVLAHEAGHSLLFGLTDREPLVFNPDDELYPSPLRRDPRPMDGIYHATFVSARMAFAMEALASSGVLTKQEAAKAREAAEQDRANFASGYGVVASSAKLSETGRQIMDAAVRWIERPRKR